VQPLVEVRAPFNLSRWELDDLSRGAEEVELGPLRTAALEAARFEEHTVYRGLADAGIQGIIARSDQRPLVLPTEVHAIPERITTALIHLSDAGVDGPYLLVLGPSEYRAVSGESNGYPLRKQLQSLVGHAPVYSPGLEGALLVSMRGGDFRLTLGVDYSIGFDRVEGDAVHLFVTETFTFLVVGPEAVVVLEPGAR
jgi:uncharacterized linocin/CFP29 family protein